MFHRLLIDIWTIISFQKKYWPSIIKISNHDNFRSMRYMFFAIDNLFRIRTSLMFLIFSSVKFYISVLCICHLYWGGNNCIRRNDEINYNISKEQWYLTCSLFVLIKFNLLVTTKRRCGWWQEIKKRKDRKSK